MLQRVPQPNEAVPPRLESRQAGFTAENCRTWDRLHGHDRYAPRTWRDAFSGVTWNVVLTVSPGADIGVLLT